MLSISEINERRFEKATFGYKPEAVDAFLFEIAESYNAIIEENKQLQAKMQVLAEKVQEYREQEDSLRDTLLAAHRLGDSILKEAKGKAEVILRDATVKADKIVETAQKKLEGEQLALTRMQREVAGFKTRLMSLYKTHIELISALPDYEEPAQEQPVKEEAPAPETAPVQEEAVVEQVAVEAAPAEQVAPAEETDAPVEQAQEEFIPDNSFDFVPKAAPQMTEAEASPAKSKFGSLQFGEEYDIKRGKHARK